MKTCWFNHDGYTDQWVCENDIEIKLAVETSFIWQIALCMPWFVFDFLLVRNESIGWVRPTTSCLAQRFKFRHSQFHSSVIRWLAITTVALVWAIRYSSSVQDALDSLSWHVLAGIILCRILLALQATWLHISKTRQARIRNVSESVNAYQSHFNSKRKNDLNRRRAFQMRVSLHAMLSQRDARRRAQVLKNTPSVIQDKYEPVPLESTYISASFWNRWWASDWQRLTTDTSENKAYFQVYFGEGSIRHCAARDKVRGQDSGTRYVVYVGVCPGSRCCDSESWLQASRFSLPRSPFRKCQVLVLQTTALHTKHDLSAQS